MSDPKTRSMQTWTFQEDDKLESLAYAKKLQAYIEIDHHFAHGSLVISLEAPYGSGKSAFLSMWKNQLDAERKENGKAPLSVLLNAWEDDYCNEPLLSIAHSLIRCIEKAENHQTIDKMTSLKRAFRTLAFYSYFSANEVANALTGFNAIEVGEKTKQRIDGGLIKPKPDFYEAFEQRREAIRSLRDNLSGTFGRESINAIVLVDELDRCRPDYAISFLETIKHIFDVSGIVFVLAIDRDHVENSAKSLFGSELDTSEYLRKFIGRSFEFPQPRPLVLSRMFSHYVDLFMSLPKVRESAFNKGRSFAKAEEICIGLELTLRQLEEVFRILGHYFSTNDPYVELAQIHVSAAFFLCCLKVKNITLYRAIGKESLSTKSLLQFLRTLLPQDAAMYWAALFHSGKQVNSESSESFEHIWASSGEATSLASRAADLSRHLSNEWPPFAKGPIYRIYERIESATTIFGS